MIHMLKRFRRWMWLWLVGVVLAGCGRPAVTEAPLRQPQGTPERPAEARLVFVGDIMLDRRPGEAVAGGEDPFASFADLFRGADVVVGNLECVVATTGERVPKLYNFRCHPRVVPVLARYFHAVSVANNHSGDFGKEAFLEQLSLLEQGGLRYFGGGRNDGEAHSPLILERNSLRIALLGYDDVELRSYEAGPETPGVAWADDERVLADIQAARAKADVVVVYPHWGLEYQPEPSERQRSLARRMVDAGADLVVGAHPHVTQTVEWYKDRLIVYSLGNFVFDDFLDVPASLNEPSRTSWILRVTVAREGIKRWDTVIARTDDSGIPRPVKGAQSPCALPEGRGIGSCSRD
jgi:hypothetical protein